MKLEELVTYLDDYLRLEDFDDRSDNGLQVEGRREVRRVGFAVDACLEAFEKAEAAHLDALIVHHGLFWGEPLMVTGSHRRRLQVLLGGDISLYTVHQPLDAHPEVGNNVELARLLGLKPTGQFGLSGGQLVGLLTTPGADLPLEELGRRLGQCLGVAASVWPFRKAARNIGVLSGYAMGVLDEAIESGLEALVCGELGHTAYHPAKEAGLGVVLGGHYATETVGLKALMRHLEARYDLGTLWIEVPTGL